MTSIPTGKVLHWLSFGGRRGLEDKRFLGVAIIEAPDFMAALMKAHDLGCNPGGECHGFEIAPHIFIPDEFTGRLLGKKEIALLDARARRDSPEPEPGRAAQ